MDTHILKYEQFLNEGKGTHLPDEGDGFFDTFASTITDAVNRELKDMYSKELKESSAKFDRAGIVIDLIKKGFNLKKEIWKNAIEDLKETIEDSEYVKGYRDSLLFYKYIPLIKEVLEEKVKQEEKSNSIYPDDIFINTLEEVYNMYDAEHNVAINNRMYESIKATHDNGGRPFVFDDDSGHSRIYKEVLFLGDKIKGIKKGENSSSFLIELKDKNTYVFVGTELFKFSTDEPITNFFSPIGNSDVPYPYAKSENYYYMLLDKIYVKKEDLTEKDKYQEYYKNKEKLKKYPLKNLDNIEDRLNEEKTTKILGNAITDTATFLIIDPSQVDEETRKKGIETGSLGADGEYKIEAEIDDESNSPHIPNKIIINVKESYILKYNDYINEKKENMLNVGRHTPKYNWIYRNPKEREFNLRIDDTTKYKLLKFIYNKGSEGVKYSDVLRYLFEEIKGKPYDWKKDRGNYSSVLSGEGGRTLGILQAFCTKNENGKYVLTNRQLLDHFNKLKDEGDLDTPYYERRLKNHGVEQGDIDLYNYLGISKDLSKKLDKNNA